MSSTEPNSSLPEDISASSTAAPSASAERTSSEDASPPPSPGPRLKIGTQRDGAKGGKPRQKRELSPVEKAKQHIAAATVSKTVEKPNIRQKLSDDLELEIAQALGDRSIDSLLDPLSATESKSATAELEPDSRVRGRVARIHRDDVFVDLGGRNQGVLSLRQLAAAPNVGDMVEVAVNRLDPEDGLYQLSLPGAAADIGDWSDLAPGLIVEAVVTGHNKGGLECEVNRIRGFIPAGQVSLYRIEDFSECVGQKLTCLVTEANQEKRNLVLSRRAVLETEKAEAKQKLMGELAEGQVREGVVRSLQDFGAFVDLGGVDGLIHISQLSWERVKHPSEVLQIGQRVKVLIRKIDPATGKLSLAFRDLTDNPWDTVSQRFPITSIVRGTVTRLMDFGAFVQLEPGVEGLVHISELRPGRVWRARDAVQEGEEVDVKVLSIDAENRRISLSIKQAMAKAESEKAPAPEPEEESLPAAPSPQRKGPLKGGLGSDAPGERFGLNW